MPPLTPTCLPLLGPQLGRQASGTDVLSDFWRRETVTFLYSLQMEQSLQTPASRETEVPFSLAIDQAQVQGWKV